MTGMIEGFFLGLKFSISRFFREGNFVEAFVAVRLTPRTPDLVVRGSSLACRVVSLDKELYSTLYPPRCINGYWGHTAGGNPAMHCILSCGSSNTPWHASC